MRSLRKLGSGLTAFALCFLLTGFLGSGEKPQDCITAIIKALENNDSAAFAERVPLEFFISASTVMNQEFQESMKAGLAAAKLPEGSKEFASALATAITPDIIQQALAERENVLSRVGRGTTGMRTWNPEILNKLTVSGEGTGAEAGTATATLQEDGKTVVLGLAKINGKWRLMSLGGNKKSALDSLVMLQTAMAQQAEELPQRRKGNEMYLKELAPLFDRLAKLAEAENVGAGSEAARAYAKLISTEYPDWTTFKDVSDAKINSSSVTLESPELWEAVTANLTQAMLEPEPEPHSIKGEHRPSATVKRCAEVVFKSDTVLIVKAVRLSLLTQTEEVYSQWYEQWLSGNLKESTNFTDYECYVKQDGEWRFVAESLDRNGGSAINHLLGDRKFSFSPLDYLKAFGERYASLVNVAKERVALVKNKEKEKIAELCVLLSEKKGDAFVERLDLQALAFWDLANSGGIAKVSTYTETPRQSLVDSINATGACTINGITLNSEILQKAGTQAYKDGALHAFWADGNIWFVPAEDGTMRLVSTARSLSSGTKNELARNYEKFQRLAAITTCVGALLDTVQVSVKKCTVAQSKTDHNLIKKTLLGLEMEAELTTTAASPRNISSIQVSFIDDEGKIQAQSLLETTSVKVEPYRSTRVKWLFGLSEADMIWMQQAREGKVRISVRPASINVSGEYYSLDYITSYAEKSVKLPDGTWQLADSGPVKPNLFTAMADPKKVNAKLTTLLEQQKTQESARLLEVKKALIDKVVLEYSPERRTLVARNNLQEFKAEVTKIAVETLESGTVKNSREVALPFTVRAGSTTTIEDMNIPIPAGSTLHVRVADMKFVGGWERGKVALHSGVVPPLLYQDDPVLFTLTQEQLAGTAKADAPKTDAPKADTPKTEATETASPAAPPKVETPGETPKAETQAADTKADAKPESPAAAPKGDTPKAEAPKADAPKADTPAQGVAATGVPTPPEGKNSGKAVLGTTTLDLVGLTTFGPDGKPDSSIRVSVQNPSPLVAVRIDNIGGTMSSWKTSGVKTSAKGVIAVVQDGKPLNAADAAFSLDVTNPVVLDLLVQDQPAQGTGVIAEGKTRLRAVFHHQDGKRSYAILEPEKK